MGILPNAIREYSFGVATSHSLFVYIIANLVSEYSLKTDLLRHCPIERILFPSHMPNLAKKNLSCFILHQFSMSYCLFKIAIFLVLSVRILITSIIFKQKSGRTPDGFHILFFPSLHSAYSLASLIVEIVCEMKRPSPFILCPKRRSIPLG